MPPRGRPTSSSFRTSYELSQLPPAEILSPDSFLFPPRPIPRPQPKTATQQLLAESFLQLERRYATSTWRKLSHATGLDASTLSDRACPQDTVRAGKIQPSTMEISPFLPTFMAMEETCTVMCSSPKLSQLHAANCSVNSHNVSFLLSLSTQSLFQLLSRHSRRNDASSKSSHWRIMSQAARQEERCLERIPIPRRGVGNEEAFLGKDGENVFDTLRENIVWDSFLGDEDDGDLESDVQYEDYFP